MEEKINFDTLKQAVKMEVDQRIDTLTAELHRWKSYNEKRANFSEWLKLVENKLESISVVAVDLETPEKFQVGIREKIEFHMF